MASSISPSPQLAPPCSRLPTWPPDTTMTTPTIDSTEPTTAPSVSRWPSSPIDSPSTIMGVSEPMMPMCVAVVMYAAY